jgi:hypothetical protein
MDNCDFNQNILKFKVFKLKINVSDPYTNYVLLGNGFDLVKNDNLIQIFLNLPNEKCLFVQLTRDGKISVFTPSLYRFPIYYRFFGNELIFSNQVSTLFEKHETVFVDPFVFFRHLTGCPYPQENFFVDFKLLDSSSLYKFNNKTLSFISSLLMGGNSSSNNDAIECISEKVAPDFSTGRPVSILLSGGYDSRFNLALGHYYSKKFGNKIKLYHEYKNAKEFEIVKRLSESINLPFTLIDRTTFLKNKQSRIFRDNSQIDLQSGFYRENLVRWHEYFQWIGEDNKDAFIWGFGVEAHKGKFYNYFDSIDDAINVFGTKNNILELARQSGLEGIYNSEISFLQNLIFQSKEFNSLSSQVDFVHYHSYCAGFGKRCHNLFQNFNMSFPFLDPEFLKIVFSLPRSEKENFKIIYDGIQKFSKPMMNIPFVSGNEKSLHKKGSIIQFRDNIRNLFGNQKRKYFRQPSSKSNIFLQQSDVEFINDFVPNSPITLFLKDLLLNKWANVSSLQLDYILQSFYYFVHCEVKYKVKFEFKK